MELFADKAVVFCSCMAWLFARGATPSPPSFATGEAAEVAVALAALTLTALHETVPERWRFAAPATLCLIAPAAQTGVLFLPLASYDALAELHRGMPRRLCVVLAPASLLACIGAWAPQPADVAAVAAIGALSTLLSLRTRRMQARRLILNRIRDDIALRARRLSTDNETLLRRLAAQEAGARSEGAVCGEATSERSENGTGTAAAEPQEAGLPSAFSCLTEREREVARLVAEGLDNKEIAATTYLSEGTVRNHISSILAKTHLRNRTQIAIAYWRG